MAIDANFRLRNLLHSDDVTDPGLHTGMAYFVETKGYKEHVAKYATQKDVSFIYVSQTGAERSSD